MTFSSRWLLAFRVGGATVALLTHCPACHVVFNHSSWLIPSSSKPPARRCEASVLQLTDAEMAAIFKSNKTCEITFFFYHPVPHRYTAVKTLHLSWCETWSRQREVFESLALARCCLSHPAVSAQQKSARTPVLIFLLLNQHKRQKHAFLEKKKKSFGFVIMLLLIWLLRRLFASNCGSFCLRGEKKKMKEEIQM